MEPTRAAVLGATLLTIGSLGCRSPLPRNMLPIDALEAGMTPEAVRALVGEAEGEDPSAWVYQDEVAKPSLFLLSVPLAPALILAIPIIAIVDVVEGTETPPLWVEKRTTTLHFEDERLARWNSNTEPYPAWQGDGSPPTWQPIFPGPTFGWPDWERQRRNRRRGGC